MTTPHADMTPLRATLRHRGRTRWGGLPLLLVLAWVPGWAGCASTPTGEQSDPVDEAGAETENRGTAEGAADRAPEPEPDTPTNVAEAPDPQKWEPFHKVLLKVDFALDGYVRAVNNTSVDRPDNNGAALEK